MKDFNFNIPLTVRINDLNYGAHVGHQHFLSYFQEARMAYLKQWGYTELDIEGTGMVVGEVGCRYKQQLFYDDVIEVGCRAEDLKSKRFTMRYRIERAGKLCAEGFSLNFCFDYQAQKVAPLPQALTQVLKTFEGI